MTTFRLGLLAGDGIGPEIVPAAARIMDHALERAGHKIEWVELPMGWAAIEAHGDPMPESNKAALETCDAWLMGPHNAASYPPEYRRGKPPAGQLRIHFDLFANIRPSRTFKGVESVVPEADLVIIRENTEGFLADRNMAAGVGEFMPTPDVALCVGVFKRASVERVIRMGFDLAARRKKRVTVVHKSGPLPLTLGMYKKVIHELAPEYPGIRADDCHVDTMAALLVRKPHELDVIVAENLLGDILTDLASELVGGLGLGSSVNISTKHAMAAASHGSAPDIAGKGIANPTGIILAGAMLLGWLGQRRGEPGAIDAQRRIENAVAKTLASSTKTRDMGGEAGTEEVAEAILRHMDDESRD
jgi:3-isopropylmalate dehydrogenase